MKSFFLNHIIPIVLAISIVLIGLFFFDKLNSTKIQDTNIIIEGEQTKLKGRYGTILNHGDEGELNFMASMKNKSQLTIFGSSEFCDLNSIPYNFFPDSLGKQCLGIGHAYHQSLPILIELLAAHVFNDSSEVCILISPGWFQHGGGTNSSAFIEFARPNFLDEILNNNDTPLEYKSYIGEYINTNSNNFNGLSKTMEQFITLYKLKETNNISPLIDEFIKEKITPNFSNTKAKNITYIPELTYTESKKWDGNYTNILKTYQDNFISQIHNNKLYVNDDYYKNYLIDDSGEEKFVILNDVNFEINKEFRDFKKLVSYLKSRNMKASFVIIPFNPYYYRNTEIFLPLIDSLTTILDKNNLPCLNMYVTDTNNYEPGTLKDVMHLGDYGWMKVNEFIDSIYYK